MPALQVGDIELHYEATGSGLPVLFLHGLGSSVHDWAGQVEAFAAYFRVLRVDLRGHGRSGKPPGPYSVAGMARDVAGLLERLDARPAHVVGLSMGGIVALQLALDHPACVGRLVLVNTTAEINPRSLLQRIRIERRLLRVRVLGLRVLGWVLGHHLLPGRELRARRKAFSKRYAQNDKRAYLATLDAIVGWSVVDCLGELHMPVLVVASEHDYTSTAYKQAYAERIPHARLVVVPDARHGLPGERPSAFNEVVLPFLISDEPQTPAP